MLLCLCGLYISQTAGGVRASPECKNNKQILFKKRQTFLNQSRISSFSFPYKQSQIHSLFSLYTAHPQNMADCKLQWRACGNIHLFFFSFIRQTFSRVFCLGSWVRGENDRQTEGEGAAGDGKNMRKKEVRDNHTLFTKKKKKSAPE